MLRYQNTHLCDRNNYGHLRFDRHHWLEHYNVQTNLLNKKINKNVQTKNGNTKHIIGTQLDSTMTQKISTITKNKTRETYQ